MLSAAAPSPVPTATVTVEGVRVGTVSLSAVALGVADLFLPPDSAVESADLRVTVVPPPVHLRLAFDPRTLTVTAGGEMSATLSLLDVPADIPALGVLVNLFVADELTVRPTLENDRFTVATTGPVTTATVTVEGVNVGSETVTAMAVSTGDLPPGSTVESAELEVTVVPPMVELQLAFEPSSLTVAVGERVSVTLRLLGEVPDAAVVSVLSSAADGERTVRVLPESSVVIFDAVATTRTVTLTGAGTGNTTLTAMSVTALNLSGDSLVESAELPVTVVPPPVHLTLAFEPRSLAFASGSSVTAMLRLLGEVPEDAAVTVELSATDGVEVQLMPESVVFTSAATSPVVTATVTLTGATAGRTMVRAAFTGDLAEAGLPPNSTVEPAELAVSVRLLYLAFDPPALTVAVGESETVTLRLLGGVLPAGGVEVGAAVDIGIDERNVRLNDHIFNQVETLVFDAETMSGEVTITGRSEGDATLTGEFFYIHPPRFGDEFGVNYIPLDAEALPITVVPAPIRLTLAFEPSTLTLVAGEDGHVDLLIPDMPPGFVVLFALSVEGAAVRLGPDTEVLLNQGAGFTSGDPGYSIQLEGVSAGDAVVTASWDNSPGALAFCRRDNSFANLVCDLPLNSIVESAELPVTVIPAPVDLQLEFDPTSLTVAVNSERTAVLSLSGVTVGAAVTVTLSVAGEAARLLTQESPVLDANTPSREVTLEGVAEGSATLMAAVSEAALAASGLTTGSTVASVALPVTVVAAPLDPVTLTLAFDPTLLMVTADSSETVALHLPNVPSGVEVAVTVSAADETDETIARALPQPVRLTADEPSADVRVLGVAAGSVRLTAAADISALPAGSSVTSAELAVTVIPAPVHLQLEFVPPTLTLAVGETAESRLILRVPEGAFDYTTRTITVAVDASWSSAAASLVELLGHLVPGFNFLSETTDFVGALIKGDEARANEATSVTLTVVALSGSLLEEACQGLPEHLSCELPPGSTVGYAELAVTVLPPPLHLQLSFDPVVLTVARGTTAPATLRLRDVPAGADVEVRLNTGSEAVVQVMPDRVIFTAAMQSHAVTLTGVGVVEGVVPVVASADEDDLAGFPPNSSVASAELAVTVVPAPVHLALAFDLPSLTVVAGSEETVTLRLPGVPAGLSVPIAFRAQNSPSVAQLQSFPDMFNRNRDSGVLRIRGEAVGAATITASVSEAGGVLCAIGSECGLPPDSTVEPAVLPIRVVPPPVHLHLAFDQSALTIAVGSVERLPTLRLLGLDAVPDDIDLRDITFSIGLSPDAADEEAVARVLLLSLVFPGDRPWADRLMIEAGGVAGSVTVTAVLDVINPPLGSPGSLPPNSTVESAELLVTVVRVPVDLQLEFDPSTLTVVAGGTATATLFLPGVPRGDSVRVELSVPAETTARVVTPKSVVFDADTASRAVTLEGVIAGEVTLTAEADISGLPTGSVVMPVELEVAVVPPPVHLELMFEPPALTVVTGATATAVLSLVGVPEGSRVRVEVRAADVALAQVAPAGVVKFAPSVRTRLELAVMGVAEGSATINALVFDSDLPPDSTVENAELPVTVVLPPVDLALAFAPSALTVVAGSTATAVLSLPGVPEDVEVAVTLLTFNEETARVSPELVIFDASTPSHVVTVTGGEIGGSVTRDVTLSALADDSDLPPDSTVEPAQLPVTVVPAPARLRLVFDPSTLTLVAGSRVPVELLLMGDGLPSLGVSVRVLSADTEVAGTPGLFGFRRSQRILIGGVAAGNTTLTASVTERTLADLPPNSTAEDGVLPVTVIPAPVDLQLRFDPPALDVVAGAATTAQLSLADTPAGAAVTVTLGTEDAATAQVTPAAVTFTAGAPSTVVTLTGVVAGDATVTAEVDADALAASDLPPNSTVASARLPVTVVPAPVDLQLRFDPTSLTVVVGSERTAVLSLSGVTEGAAVGVNLFLNEMGREAVLVMPIQVIFDAAMPSTEVTVTGVAVGEGLVGTAADADPLFSGLPPDSSVGLVNLPVTVVPAPPDPVTLTLAFVSPPLTVTAGREETAVLRLLGDVPDGVEVEVTVSAADETTAQVLSQTVRLTADDLERDVRVLGVAAGSLTLTAAVGRDALDNSGLPAGSTVAAAELAVTVVWPTVELQLAFDPTSLTVAVDDAATVTLRLEGVPEVARVAVTVFAEGGPSVARVAMESMTVEFGATTVSHSVTVEGVAAGSATVSALLVDHIGLSADSSVAPAELAVTVVPAPVHLAFEFDLSLLTVVVGSEETVTLRLPNVQDSFVVPLALSVEGAAARLGITTRSFLSTEGLHFASDNPSHTVFLDGVSAGEATLTASWDTSTEAVERCRSAFASRVCGLPPNSTVAPAQLPITVVEQVRLALEIDPPALTVAVGNRRTVTLSLPGVPAGAAVPVTLSTASEVEVTPESVTFDAATTSRDMTVSGVAEGSAALTATVSEAALAASGLPDGATVAPVELAVTVVPAPPDPVTLTLAFVSPPLTVTADGRETVVLSLPDVPTGVAVTVGLAAVDGVRTVRLMPDEVIFTADTPDRDVTILGVAAGNVTLTATVSEEALEDSGLPAGSSVASAELAVTVVPAPIRLALSFDTMSLTVTAGDVATAVLTLPVPLPLHLYAVGVVLTSADVGTVELVMPSAVTFDASMTAHTVTIRGVSEGSATVTATPANFLLPPNSTVTSVQLRVTVVPAPVHFRLAFEPPELTVVEDSVKAVALRLLDETPEGAAFDLGNVAFAVTVSSADRRTARVSMESVSLQFFGDRSGSVEIEGVTEGSVTVTAAIETARIRIGTELFDVPPGSTLEGAQLAVTVVPPPVHLQLAFDLSVLEVVAGATATAVLSLLNMPENSAVTVTLSVPDASTARVVTVEPVTFTAAATRPVTTATVVVEGVAAGIAPLTAFVGEDALAESGLPPDSTVASTQLKVTVAAAPVHLQLVFDPPALTVAVGNRRTVTLSLPGVPAGAEVTVELDTAFAPTVEVSPGVLAFTAAAARHEVTVTGVAEGSATVTAMRINDFILPDGSSVAGAELAVTVVERPTVHLQLAFEAPTLTVVAGATATAVLSLPGVPAVGASVTVELDVAEETTAQAMPESVVFDAATTRREVTITGVATGSVTVTAIETTFSGLSTDSTVAAAELVVTVIPPPVHLRLAFGSSALTVVVLDDEAVSLQLLGALPEVAIGRAVVEVALSSADDLTARVTPDLVMFDAMERLLYVEILGTGEGSVTIEASVSENALDESGLPPDSTVASARLEVRVVPPPVHLRLTFEPPELTVAEDSSKTVLLRLRGEVPEDATFELEDIVFGITVSSADRRTARVSMESVSFTGDRSQSVGIEGVTEGNVTVTAEVTRAFIRTPLNPLPPNSNVEDAHLLVTVVPPPVHLALAFDRVSLTVAANTTETVVLSISDVPYSAEVPVTLSLVDSLVDGTAARVASRVVFIDRALSRNVAIMGVVAGSATLTASVGKDVLAESSLPPDSTVEDAQLAVTVVAAPVELALVFDPPALTVVVGSDRTAVLSLSGVPEGAEVTVPVRLSVADAATARVESGLAVFTARTLSRALSRDVRVMGVAAGNTTLTATVSEEALAASGLPDGSTVASVELAVTVVAALPDPVTLTLAFVSPPLTVTAGHEETAMLRLLGDVPDGVEVAVTLRAGDVTIAQAPSQTVRFTTDDLERDVRVLGVAAGNVTLTATVSEEALAPENSGLPAGSSVADAELAVTVLPAPVAVILRLEFVPTTLEVPVGRSEPVRLELSDVPEGASVTVELITANASTAQVVTETELVVFTADVTRHMVRVMGVGLGDVTITADDRATLGLPDGSSVAPGALRVMVIESPGIRLRVRLLLEGPLQ